MSAYKITDWNEDIIQKINELCENPDPGCEPLDPLEEVTDPHRWSVEDIEDAQDKLKEICDENEFEAELKLWKQEIVDELKEAIENEWCLCCLETVIHISETQMLCRDEIIGTGPTICGEKCANIPTCLCCPGVDYPPTIGTYTEVKDIIDGLQIIEPTETERFWGVYKNFTNGSTQITDSTLIANGTVGLDGVIHYTGSASMQDKHADGQIHRWWNCGCAEFNPGWPLGDGCCKEWGYDIGDEIEFPPVGHTLNFTLKVARSFNKLSDPCNE